MKIKVKVKPNAKKEEVVQTGKDQYQVKVSVPPEKGKANKRVVELLSKHLNVPKSRIKLLKGETSREKLFEVEK
ncbi:MAG: DUF167 domain-containing protein [Aquificae bacterium]|nr:DUF167 domain-containing protein [Aquificota bacterium]